MSYVPEFSDLRPEVRVGVASTLTFYPKAIGAGNVTASSVAGDCTATIYDPSGNVLSGPTQITPVAVSGLGSRFDIAVPAIGTMAEDYRVDVAWKVSGESLARLDALYFDVCREPWSTSSVTLSSLLSYVPDIADRLERQAAVLNQTVEQRAAVLGHQARVELGNWLRQTVAEDVGRLMPRISAKVTDVSAADGYLRPRLVKDRARLANVEVKLALAAAFAGDMRADDEDGQGDGVATLQSYWAAEAKSSYRAIGPMRYDIDDDGVVDTVARDVNRYTPSRRVQS